MESAGTSGDGGELGLDEVKSCIRLKGERRMAGALESGCS
jgi:hypothetical protein